MSVYLIYYQDRAKYMRPVSNREGYLKLRGDVHHTMILSRVRNGETNLKNKLIQFNYSCIPEGNPNMALPLKGCKTPSMSVGMDVDIHRDDYDNDNEYQKALDAIPEKVLSKKDELGLLMLERSASKGYHLVFKRKYLDGLSVSPEGRLVPVNESSLLENQVLNLKWASDLLGVEFDDGAKDITRVFFSTSASKEDLLFLSDELFNQGTGFQPEGDSVGAVPAAPAVQPVTQSSAFQAHAQASAGVGALKPHAQASAGVGALKPHAQASAGVGAKCLEDTTERSDSNRVHGSEANVCSDKGDSSKTPLPAQGGAGGGSLSYQGIPYADIIQRWWELYNGGQEPVKSNRDVLTYELAVNLRHICGFDRELMDKIIPCYDEFPQVQKMKCIDSALAEKRTQMPFRLKNILQALRKDYKNDLKVQEALDSVQMEDELFYYKRFPQAALPQGVLESVKAAGDAKVMPVIGAVCPMIGMLATNVKVEIHQVPTHLNLISYVCGDAASGKGSVDPIVTTWMSEIQAQDDVYIHQEDEYRERKKKAKNAKEQPVEPKLPVRFLPLNNTLANIAERLANTDGLHSFSFTPETDTIAMKWKSSMSDYSVMLRQAYDGSRFDREAKSAEAVNVHIKKLLWNVTMCGTQDALYRLITNYTDGLLSRVCIARLPDNTFSPLPDKTDMMIPRYEDKIKQVAHLLPLMQGTLVLPKLEAKSREWVEKVRLEAVMNNDSVLAKARLRNHIKAQRMTTCLILCAVAEKLIKQHGINGAERVLKEQPEITAQMAVKAQTPSMLEAYDVIADSLIDNEMYFFRDRIEAAYNKVVAGTSIRAHRGKNDTIYTKLASKFTLDDAVRESVSVKGTDCSRNSVTQMLKNWKNQKMIIDLGDLNYQKCA